MVTSVDIGMRVIVSGSDDRSVRVWDRNTFEEIGTLHGKQISF
jgi:WD40 repeat protein